MNFEENLSLLVKNEIDKKIKKLINMVKLIERPGEESNVLVRGYNEAVRQQRKNIQSFLEQEPVSLTKLNEGNYQAPKHISDPSVGRFGRGGGYKS